MKKAILLLSMFACIHLFAQNTDSLGYLSNLKGKGMLVRKGAELELKIPFFFLKGDLVRIISGNAILVLYNQDEVKLVAGQSYSFVEDKNPRSGKGDFLFNINSKKSASSFKMRGSANQQIFPKKSKIADISKAIIHFDSRKYEFYFFKLIDNQTKEPVYNIKDLKVDLIDLSTVPFKEGTTYEWRLKLPEFIVEGDLELLPEEDRAQIQTFELNNRASYVNAFNYYCNKECYFEALEVINAAIKAYPEDDYFVYLKKTVI